MLEVHGKYTSAKVFTDVVDDVSIEQVKTLCSQEVANGSCIRMMPDIHAGDGCTIGTAMTITDKIVPNLVGVDIGCGMLTEILHGKDLNLEELDKFIREKIPSGHAIHDAPHDFAESTDIKNLYCAEHVDLDRAYRSVGTLGGGNHFIEIDRDQFRQLYLIIHSGSRHLGVEVATYYQKLAIKELKKKSDAELKRLINKMKEEGRAKEIQSNFQQLKDMTKIDIPDEFAYLQGELFDDYIHDMRIVQDFANINRYAIGYDILVAANTYSIDRFTTVHNYIDTDTMILRKGAVSAKEGERLLIPINMRDGSLICIGKGNEDWNYSAPHGAGRLMSRAEARRRFSVEEFQQSMDGIYTTSVDVDTIDECPMAYKSMQDIIDNIGPTADVTSIIRPIYNFKAKETIMYGQP